MATAKIKHANVDTNGEAAGLALINSLNPNHFVKTGLQYKSDTDPNTPGDQNGKWAERVVTSDGNAVVIPPATVPWPNSGALNLTGEYVWVRFIHDADAKQVTTWTSTNGTTFSSFGPAISVEQYLNRPGGFRIGLFGKHDGSGDDIVDVDAFNVEFGTADPDAPGDECPPAGDITPPRTTHALDPAQPDGANGWYKTPVKVTLDATDNDGGSGVDTTEYRFAGDEEWTAYSAPFTVSDPGRHTVEYRSTDADGNVESAKSVTFRIDPAAPTTTAKLNGEAPKPSYDGPVQVDLDADDGTGSGVNATEIRIDGGEWQPYAEEETILNSAADLGRWAQAGGGRLEWMSEDGGRPHDQRLRDAVVPGEGLRRLLAEAPVPRLERRQRGQLRCLRPVPTPGGGRPAARRPALPMPGRLGPEDPAWVAIFCGDQLQINDHQGSEPQKTGSVYNFSALNATQAKVQPKGTWVDYEIRVVGQTYTISRNGEVLQTFENTPDKPSSRPGDPSTRTASSRVATSACRTTAAAT